MPCPRRLRASRKRASADVPEVPETGLPELPEELSPGGESPEESPEPAPPDEPPDDPPGDVPPLSDGSEGGGDGS